MSRVNFNFINTDKLVKIQIFGAFFCLFMNKCWFSRGSIVNETKD